MILPFQKSIIKYKILYFIIKNGHNKQVQDVFETHQKSLHGILLVHSIPPRLLSLIFIILDRLFLLGTNLAYASSSLIFFPLIFSAQQVFLQTITATLKLIVFQQVMQSSWNYKIYLKVVFRFLFFTVVEFELIWTTKSQRAPLSRTLSLFSRVSYPFIFNAFLTLRFLELQPIQAVFPVSLRQTSQQTCPHCKRFGLTRSLLNLVKHSAQVQNQSLWAVKSFL